MKTTGQTEWLRTEDKGMHKIQSKIKSLLMQLGEEVEEGGWGDQQIKPMKRIRQA